VVNLFSSFIIFSVKYENKKKRQSIRDPRQNRALGLSAVEDIPDKISSLQLSFAESDQLVRAARGVTLECILSVNGVMNVIINDMADLGAGKISRGS
jgi:hypothetical protein